MAVTMFFVSEKAKPKTTPTIFLSFLLLLVNNGQFGVNV